MADPATRSYRWSREAYDRAIQTGIFGPGDRIELIDGEIITMTPQGSRLYARCGIPEYWIVAIAGARLEVYRDPTGDAYRSVRSLRAGETVAPLARPDATIAVADLLP